MTKVWVSEPLYWLMRKYEGGPIHYRLRFRDTIRQGQYEL